MNNNNQIAEWCENVILVDADYVDKVTFNLIVNFERMLGRQIPKASMSLWIDCIALDGGLRAGENETLVVLIHNRKKRKMENFTPADFTSELSDKAFKDHLGEFIFDSYIAEERLVAHSDFFVEILQLITAQKEVKRVMVVPNAEDEYIYNKVRVTLNNLDDNDKRITVFAMQPMPGGNFRQEILGFSLMAALGIKSEEFKNKKK